jgi:Raf kinase inhibitor-like YbhB/YbcL family protein
MSMLIWKSRLLTVIVLLAIIAAGAVWFVCREAKADLSRGSVPPTLAMASASFVDGGQMPRKLTCDGANVSPDVQIPPVPPAAKSLVVVIDDLDTPFGFVHWLVYDIPASVRDIGEGAAAGARLPAHAAEGINDFGNAGYGGPCPPGGRHRYRLSVYAVDRDLGLPAGASKKKLAAAVNGHILAWGQMIGLYSRASR